MWLASRCDSSSESLYIASNSRLEMFDTIAGAVESHERFTDDFSSCGRSAHPNRIDSIANDLNSVFYYIEETQR